MPTFGCGGHSDIVRNMPWLGHARLPLQINVGRP